MNYFKMLKKFLLILLHNLFIIESYEYVLFSLMAIFIHEIAHLVFLKSNRTCNIKLDYNILGFNIKLDNDGISDNKLIMTYCIGSLSNICLGILLILVQILFSVTIFEKFIIVNLIIGFINFLPAFPLDGSNILRTILFKVTNYKVSNIISIYISYLIGFGLLIYVFIFNYLIGFNINYLILCIIIFLSTSTEFNKFNKFNKFKVNNKFKCKVTVISFELLDRTTLIDIIKLYIKYDITIFYVVNMESEIIVLYVKDVIEYYKIYGNISILEFYKYLT